MAGTRPDSRSQRVLEGSSWACEGSRGGFPLPSQDCHLLLGHESVSATTTQLEGIVAGLVELDAPDFPLAEQMGGQKADSVLGEEILKGSKPS